MDISPVDIMKFWVPLVFVTIIAVIFATVIAYIWKGKISLIGLIEEPGTGKASLSRFQFLLFIFVIAILYFALCMRAGALLDIPNGVYTLLGISGGSFLISKQISTSTGKNNPPADAGEATLSNTLD